MNTTRKVVAGLVVALSLMAVTTVAQPAASADAKVPSAGGNIWCC